MFLQVISGRVGDATAIGARVDVWERELRPGAAGRVVDRTSFDALAPRLGEIEAALRRNRPDLLGETVALHDDGTYTAVVYFTDEASARANETRAWAPDDEALGAEFMSSISVDEYIDLDRLWLR